METESEGQRADTLPGVSLRLTLFAAAAVAALFAWLPSEALLGFDAYPLIAAAREGGVLGVFTDELMAGRYPDGRFYRPLVHLAFLADDLVGGQSLNPTPFRVTDIAIAGFAAVVLAATVVSLGRLGEGEQSARPSNVPLLFGGATAILAYAAHQAQLEVVPYAPRRADAMAVLFVAATVLAALRGAKPVWLGVLTLAALLSKETGVIAVPLVFVACLVRPVRATPGEALRACIAPGIAVTIGIAARFAVLGELGGHAESGAAAAGKGAVDTALRAWDYFGAGVPGGDGGITLLLLAITTVGAATFRPGAAALAAVWALLVLALTAFSGRMHAWYVVAFLPPVALLCGTAVCAALSTHRKAAWLGGGAGASLVALLLIGTITSPQRETLSVATAIAADQTERFTAVAEGVTEGGYAPFEPWVFAASMGPGSPPVFLHAAYSLDALAELRRPGLEFVVAPADALQDAQGVTAIALFPGPPPADALPR